ncbi:MAG: hypothetical protein HY898_14195 [Deltaproteobacteria bacterium]|nr:hypothetical protein [Deltaproteobacteria bacterium]
MRATTFLALLGASLAVAACTNDVNLGDGDAGVGGTSGQAGAAGQGGTSGVGGGGGSGGSGVCKQGYADCDGNSSNGCEANLWADPAHCGACAHACSSGMTCASGKCTGGTDGGGCGNNQPCPAGQVCVANQCVADEDAGDAPFCGSGWGDCDGDPQNGCETNLATDPASCGACGQVCASGQVCVSGVCTVDQDGGPCSAGWADCDGNSQNGCEVNLESNPLHCGACGQVCAAGQVCSSGMCTVDQDGGPCSAGWADCDGLSQNGCEVNIYADPMNCGACANMCVGGQICVAGLCASDQDGGDAADAGPALCDPFTNTGCSSPYACVVGIPYYSDADIYCFPSGNTPAGGACSPQALCAPGTECVHEDPYGNGHCRKFCDYGGGPHGCPSGETCKSILHPTIGICTP